MTTASYPSFPILAVDDEPAWLRSLRVALGRAGVDNLVTCQDAREVPALLAGRPFGLVLLDLNMPHVSGEELLARITVDHPEVTVIVISGMNQIETAVRCVKLGALEYFVKTQEEDRLVTGVLRAVRMLELERENREMASRVLSGAPRHPESFEAIVTRDRAMLAVFSYVEAVARSSQPLLVQGESGVGKELVARAAHALSGRAGPMVAVNAAGLDDAVFADTLFGHARGAFTGAEQARPGMIEAAADGTLFLDEIGDLAIPSQVKLLRLVQEGEYFPLGSDRPKRLRARVIVATHHDLAAKQAAGTFRRDLYYRLATHQVRIPPLRERKGDIPVLLEHFLAVAARELGKKKPTAPRELAVLLSTYSFPGNVRELKAMVHDAVSVHRERILSMETFVRAIERGGGAAAVRAAEAGENPFARLEQLPTIKDTVELLVEEAISRGGGNQTIAARLLGITQSALSKRLKASRES
ncbi:sigma-54-dependent transcriptional regulator [Anaeromyxobacter terrae]|uniref:sigma-54-dependent transcriptional regulator n=1 Tax=Anaeromyxobacter terrae TaxID=2925406 RepID=UPI001F5933EB|nr:sigma-54 dependent transcriptional regulator [Anaeromyxobacter sp. SG22]